MADARFDPEETVLAAPAVRLAVHLWTAGIPWLLYLLVREEMAGHISRFANRPRFRRPRFQRLSAVVRALGLCLGVGACVGAELQEPQYSDIERYSALTATAAANCGAEEERCVVAPQLLEAGPAHTCGVIDGTLYCWGDSVTGGPPYRTLAETDRSVPFAVTFPGVPRDVRWVGGDSFRENCAVSTEGTAYCWEAETDLGVHGRKPTPSQAHGLPFTHSVGAVFAILPPRRSTPITFAVSDHLLRHAEQLQGVVQIASNSATACARTCNGAVVCTDEIGRFKRHLTCGASDIDSAWNGACYVLAAEGTVVCEDPALSALAARFSNVAQVAMSTDHLCTLQRSGQVWCAGKNDHGQLGDGTTEARTAPVQAVLPSRVIAIAAGNEHTCVHAVDAFYCWGGNSAGQLGVGDFADRSLPTRVLFKGSTLDPEFDTLMQAARATRDAD